MQTKSKNTGVITMSNVERYPPDAVDIDTLTELARETAVVTIGDRTGVIEMGDDGPVLATNNRTWGYDRLSGDNDLERLTEESAITVHETNPSSVGQYLAKTAYRINDITATVEYHNGEPQRAELKVIYTVRGDAQRLKPEYAISGSSAALSTVEPGIRGKDQLPALLLADRHVEQLPFVQAVEGFEDVVRSAADGVWALADLVDTTDRS